MQYNYKTPTFNAVNDEVHIATQDEGSCQEEAMQKFYDYLTKLELDEKQKAKKCSS